uniref:Uncharacterized protein n=1 Tax=Anguilla anguilla TaxID=7936 RepID=A0A0E9XIF3_ANGAN
MTCKTATLKPGKIAKSHAEFECEESHPAFLVTHSIPLHSLRVIGSSVLCSSILPPCTLNSSEKKSSSSIGPGAALRCSSSLP